jgi:hypothetical protein
VAYKLKYATEAEIPADLKQAYKAQPDGYWRYDADDIPDVSALYRARDHEKAEVKKLRDQLQTMEDQYKDLDPEQAREALAKLKEIDEKTLISKGNIDELLDKRFSSERKGLQGKIDSLLADIQSRDENLSSLTQELGKTSRQGELGKALIDARVDPKWYEFIEMKAEKTWRWENGKLVPYDGKDPLYVEGKIPDMRTWIGAFVAKQRPDILLPSTGGGANGGTARGHKGEIVLSRDEARDRGKFLAAQKQAEKEGIPFRIEPPPSM